MTTRQVLEAAKARIDKPQKWSGKNAYSKDGKRVCAVVAIAISADSPIKGAVARNRVRKLIPDTDCTLAEFNDSHTHAEVMALFDRAIARAK